MEKKSWSLGNGLCIRAEVLTLGKDDKFYREIHFFLLTSVRSSLHVLLKITTSATNFSFFFIPVRFFKTDTPAYWQQLITS